VELLDAHPHPLVPVAPEDREIFAH
jgi:hypothetical protein